MADISKFRVNGSTYDLKDAKAAKVDDSVVSSTLTWSSQKIQSSVTPIYVDKAIPSSESRPSILLKIVD